MRLDSIGPAIEAARRAAPEIAKLNKASRSIEAMFIKDLLSTMRKSVSKTPLGGQGYGSEVYQDLFDHALSESAAKTGSLGIGRTFSRDFAKTIWRQALAETTKGRHTGGFDMTDGKP